MKRGAFQIVAVLVFVAGQWLHAARQPVPAPEVPAGDPETTYSLSTERQPVTSLEGEWRFQPGDDPQWAAPGFDDSRWALVSSGSDWDDAGYHHLDGTAWYRFHVILPAGSEHYSLYLPIIYTSYQVFVNGSLLLTSGQMPPHPEVFRGRPVVLDLPYGGTRPSPQTLTIALRVWHAPVWSAFRHGGLQGVAEIGRSDLMHRRFDTQEEAHLWQYSDEIDLGALELLAALVALALLITRRKEREFLWFGLLMLAKGTQHLVIAWDHLHAHPIVIAAAVESLLATGFLVFALLFFRTLFAGKWTNAYVFALACCGLDGLLFPLVWMGAITVFVSNAAHLILLLPVYGWILFFVRRQAKKRDPDGRILRGPVVVLVAAALYSSALDMLQSGGLLWSSHLLIRAHQPFYVTLDDVAEVIFLAAMLTILLRRFALRSREQDRVHSELEAARSVQQVLVPESLPEIPGLSIETAYHPAQEVGGDFFQILPVPGGSTLIVIGDVAGKGLPAALQVSLVVGTLRALAERTTSPAEILSGLNRSLQGRGPGFTTCLALCLSPDRTVMTFANAGHIAPYVNGFELRTEANLPLGITLEATFDEVRYTLKAGDHVTVLTDGVPEAMHQKELFGFERTGQVSRGQAGEIADAARTFGQSDDITVLTIDVVPLTTAHTEQLEPVLQPA